MVLHLRRLVCLLHILRPSARGLAFLIVDSSRATLSTHSPPPPRPKMTTSATNGASSQLSSSSVGQKDIGRSIEEPPSGICENNNDDDAENADSLETDAIINKSWRAFLDISIARSRKIRGSNYVQIATVDSITKEPRCRTVVFRGFLALPTSSDAMTITSKTTSNNEHVGSTNTPFDPSTSFLIDPVTDKPVSCILKMCTDLRSEKVHQTGPTEVVWWFPKTSEQYRIRGTMILIGNDHTTVTEHDRALMIARKEMWGSLTDSSRDSFLTAQRPGDVYADETTRTDGNGGRDDDEKILQPPPDTFLLMLVIPSRCDYLDLTRMFRQIDTLNDGKWQAQRVNA